MKVRANTTGVHVPADFFSLRAGEVYEVSAEVGKTLLDAGVVDEVKPEPKKPAPKGKRVAGAPENKGA